jgi:hypothetical protein
VPRKNKKNLTPQFFSFETVLLVHFGGRGIFLNLLEKIAESEQIFTP